MVSLKKGVKARARSYRTREVEEDGEEERQVEVGAHGDEDSKKDEAK
jgi:hypothetical protein